MTWKWILHFPHVKNLGLLQLTYLWADKQAWMSQLDPITVNPVSCKNRFSNLLREQKIFAKVTKQITHNWWQRVIDWSFKIDHGNFYNFIKIMLLFLTRIALQIWYDNKSHSKFRIKRWFFLKSDTKLIFLVLDVDISDCLSRHFEWIVHLIAKNLCPEIEKKKLDFLPWTSQGIISLSFNSCH